MNEIIEKAQITLGVYQQEHRVLTGCNEDKQPRRIHEVLDQVEVKIRTNKIVDEFIEEMGLTFSRDSNV